MFCAPRCPALWLRAFVAPIDKSLSIDRPPADRSSPPSLANSKDLAAPSPRICFLPLKVGRIGPRCETAAVNHDGKAWRGIRTAATFFA